MLIGLFSLFLTLFSENVDIFYVDKIEQGIKKEITDNNRKKELQEMLKNYNQQVKNFNKHRKIDIRELKAMSKDRTTQRAWFDDFFKTRMDKRNLVQESVIDMRLQLQEKIHPEEWKRIMNRASVEASKLERKKERKEAKQQDKKILRSQEEVVQKQIEDTEKEQKVLAALEAYESSYHEISEKLKNIDVNNSKFLDDQNATRNEMISAINALNEQRMALYSSYTDFYFVLKANTSGDEWKPIITEITKTFK